MLHRVLPKPQSLPRLGLSCLMRVPPNSNTVTVTIEWNTTHLASVSLSRHLSLYSRRCFLASVLSFHFTSWWPHFMVTSHAIPLGILIRSDQSGYEWHRGKMNFLEHVSIRRPVAMAKIGHNLLVTSYLQIQEQQHFSCHRIV
jgi:hypothetical protein